MATIDVYKEWLGIPEGQRPPDHYTLLRLIQFEDAVDKIRANYKKLNAHVRKYATGQYQNESQELLNEMAKAMLCLTDLERKREYDVSLGREFEEKEAGPRTMDVILLEQKHISADQSKEAQAHAERTGLELRDSFVQLKMVPAEIAAQALAQELGLPYVDLADMVPDEDVLDRVPKATVKQHSILPLFIDDDKVLVACVHQIDHELEDELRLRFSVPVRSVLAVPMAINQAIGKYYAPGLRKEVVTDSPAKGTEKGKGKEKSAKAQPAEKPKEKRAARTPEELRQSRQIGAIIFCWSFVVAYGVNWFLNPPNQFFSALVTIPAFTLIPAITGFIVWEKFWKK